jgi:spore coat protein U-like protein
MRYCRGTLSDISEVAPMNKCIFVLATAGISLLAASDISADSTTAVITISATVRRNCLITTTPVAYGAYDPVGAQATAPLDATGTVVLTCTQGTTASIGLDSGSNAQGTTRRMTDGATGYLTYELYKDNGYSNIWGDTGSGLLPIGGAPSTAPRSFVVYGRVAGGQDVPVGSFADSIIATVNF